ncbi:MAG: hypothetical protein H6656_10375 [Ardenticatenaceae bacterium]|nr:hypothetical protein [Anaerolineales bacterium]MCB9007754.1 hypothetical protein [Ardenticatenaceae bacterium]
MATSNITTEETAVSPANKPAKRGMNKATLWIVFAAAVFPTHFWSLVDFLREYPAWIKRMNTSELLGAFSYVMVYALPDAILLFLGIVILALILPYRFFREKFAAMGSALALITAVWFIIFHSFPLWLEQRQLVPLGLWAISYVLVLGVAYLQILRNPKAEALVDNFMQRAVSLSALYLFIDFLSLINVLIRNF